jgi:hypothetical protein
MWKTILAYLGLGLGVHAQVILGRDAELHHLSYTALSKVAGQAQDS